MSASEQQAEWVVLGKIASPFGIKGWSKIQSHSEPKEQIFSYKPWFVEKNGQWIEVKVVSSKIQGKGLIAQLDICPDRNAAENVVGLPIAVKREQLAQLEEGEFYWRDLIGLTVVNLEDIELGKVTQLMETGSNDVLVVKGKHEGKRVERLIPYLPGEFVKQVSLAEQTIVVDWDADF